MLDNSDWGGHLQNRELYVGDFLFFLNFPPLLLGTCCFIKKRIELKMALLDLSLEPF